MSKRSWAILAALLYGAVVVLWVLTSPPARAAGDDKEKTPAKKPARAAGDDKEKTPAKKPAKAAPGADVFGLTRVHEYHIEIAAKEWEKMQPKGGMGFFGGGPGGPGGRPGGPGGPAPEKPAEKPGEKPDTHKGGGFGTEFPWAKGRFVEGDKVYDNVGIRYKGNSTYMSSARGLKRPFKIDFDHYDDAGRYQGLKTLNLNANVLDPSRMREALAFDLFRAAGVPAPRTAYAVVTLSVPGKYEKELLGLYTVVEQIDKTFLKDRFKDNDGMLMKPERFRGIQYLGEDGSKYKAQYLPRHEPTEKEVQRLIAFTKLVSDGTDEQFRKEIGSYLDVDRFLSYLAVNGLLANWDSFLSLGHNFYLYLNPKTNKFVFLPWDTDLSMASFAMGGSIEQQADLSIAHPHMGQNRLIDRVFAVKELNDKYQKLVRDLSKTAFGKETMLEKMDAIEKATKEAVAQETKAVADRKETGGGGFGGMGSAGRSMTPRQFLEKRTESVVAQLDGKRTGYVPTSFGRPGGGFGGPGAMIVKPFLGAVDADKDAKLSKEEFVAGVKKFFAEADKDRKGKLDEKALTEALTRVWPQQGGPGGGFGARQAPGLAGAILKKADTQKTGFVTVESLVTAAEALYKETDKEKKNALVEKEVETAISALMPPRFGPGGGFRGPGAAIAKPFLTAVDGDKDGKMTRDEWVAAVKKFFAEADKDKKGKLDEKALADAFTRILPDPGFGGGAGGGLNPFVAMQANGLAANVFRRADPDKTGTVTADKLVAAAEEFFKESDKEKTGGLTDKDIEPAINVMMQMRFGPGGGFGAGPAPPPGDQPAPPQPTDRPAPAKDETKKEERPS